MSSKANYSTFRASHIYKKAKIFCCSNRWPYTDWRSQDEL